MSIALLLFQFGWLTSIEALLGPPASINRSAVAVTFACTVAHSGRPFTSLWSKGPAGARVDVAERSNTPHSKFGLGHPYRFCSVPSDVELSAQFGSPLAFIPASACPCYRVG